MNSRKPNAQAASAGPAADLPIRAQAPTAPSRLWTLTLDGQGRLCARKALQGTAFAQGGSFWATADPQARTATVSTSLADLKRSPGFYTTKVRIDARGRLSLGHIGRVLGLEPGDIAALALNPDTDELIVRPVPAPQDL